MSENWNPAGLPPDSAAGGPAGGTGSAPTEAPLSPQEASQLLTELRQARIDGKVTQRDYFERMDFLSKVEAGEQVAPTGLKPQTLHDKLQQQAEADMAPPADVSGYGSLSSELSNDPELAPLDAGLRKGFLATEVPAVYARSIVESVDQTANRMEVMDAGQIKAEIDTVQRKLIASWGGQQQFDARVKLIDQLLDDMAEADPAVAELLESAPYVIACSPLALDLLARTAEHREARRGRA